MTTQVTDLVSLRAASKEMDAELAAVFAKYGLTVVGRSAKIGGGECNFTVKTITGGGEQKADKQREMYDRYADMYGLPSDGFGKTFIVQGDRFELVGLDMSKPKNCVSLKRLSDGKSFKCPPDTIKYARRVEA